MPWSPEVEARVQHLVERSDRSYAQIEAETRVSAATARYWARTRGWKRPKSAPARRRFHPEQRAAIERALAAGASVHDVALIAERHPEVIRKHCAPRRGAGGPAPEAAHEAEPVPAAVAALCETFMAGGIGRDEFLRHAPQVFAFVAVKALLGGDPQVHRTAQALAQLTAGAVKMPAQAPGGGAYRSSDDDDGMPGTYAETNDLIEELTQRLCEFGALTEDGSPIDPPAEL